MALARRAGICAPLLAAVALLAAGCGGDDVDNATAEESMRDCLTEQGLALEAADLGSSAALGTASADFQVTSSEGEVADVIVEGGEGKAQKTAADVEGAKQSFGAQQSVVVQRKNVVVVFEQEPAAEFREQVEGCI